MVDYNKSTGSSGTMRIRDTGTTVEFWLNAGNSTTFNHQLPWGYTINGVTSNNRTFDYSAGDGWQRLGAWGVTTSQTVTFRLGDTGTSGFGGPTTHSVTINRAKVPNPPGTPSATGITSTSVNIAFSDPANNGSVITARQIARNTVNTTTGATIFSSDGTTTFTGLTPGQTYYFWARAGNAVGWGPWSPVRAVTLLKLPAAPSPVVVSEITQTTAKFAFTDGNNGGAPVLERQLAVNTVNTTVDAFVFNYPGPMGLVSLSPGTTWYAWGRVRNSVGWGPWSAVKVFRTVAGAWVNVGGVWKEAVPYVKVDGVWKVAQPWVRSVGIWRESY